MSLSERIKYYRAKNRITQKDFAKMCGLSGQTIWSIEKGDQEPSDITRIKIELVIGNEEEK